MIIVTFVCIISNSVSVVSMICSSTYRTIVTFILAVVAAVLAVLMMNTVATATPCTICTPTTFSTLDEYWCIKKILSMWSMHKINDFQDLISNFSSLNYKLRFPLWFGLLYCHLLTMLRVIKSSEPEQGNNFKNSWIHLKNS